LVSGQHRWTTWSINDHRRNNRISNYRKCAPIKWKIQTNAFFCLYIFTFFWNFTYCVYRILKWDFTDDSFLLARIFHDFNKFNMFRIWRRTDLPNRSKYLKWSIELRCEYLQSHISFFDQLHHSIIIRFGKYQKIKIWSIYIYNDPNNYSDLNYSNLLSGWRSQKN